MPTHKTERKWVVTVTRAEGDDWPDTPKRYSNLVFRPQSLTIIFTDRHGGVAIESAEASGPRIIKGTPGKERKSERWFDLITGLDTGCYPDWVVSIAAEILAAEILAQVATRED